MDRDWRMPRLVGGMESFVLERSWEVKQNKASEGTKTASYQRCKYKRGHQWTQGTKLWIEMHVSNEKVLPNHGTDFLTRKTFLSGIGQALAQVPIEGPSLEVCKAWLDKTLSNLIPLWTGCLSKGWPRWPPEVPSTWMIPLEWRSSQTPLRPQ